MRYFLKIAYDGTGFHGWQRQPNAIGVQQIIEDSLSTIMCRPVEIVGSGRTDTGVHARETFAHFDTPEPIGDTGKFLVSLNRLCGRAIAISDILPVMETAHARFDATSRTYKYFIHFHKDPFLEGLSWETRPLDLERMNEAASLLPETEDFTSFAKLHSDAKTNICHVDIARWTEEGENRAVFTIRADRFLRNMVRAVVGTLVDVGRGKSDPATVKKIIESKDRCSAGTSMPAHALYLWKVEYPADIFL